jgi:membrane associated rhomboid family serine protease
MKKKFWITALTFGLPWAIIMVVINLKIKDGPKLGIIVSTLIGGIVAGLLFAWILQYTDRLFKKKSADNEKIIKEGRANHFKGKK